ncbi:glycoside hydrolase family 20 zincin-like fold domain-containing protein [Silvibacterium dinghuense]|uniref:beta-N-acetylhexosaminidase n=1 Tax=Silvibacterium dinghuense TaxID=1560006 RepID=A0A4Q1SJB6_9BACT|nr:glycoside hydrolase family 20 zincin-like fold domain-containing protein [Silvibacterium dinghuense]RXS97728.1 glycoside hydrolase [Silvibacterium dinghuense]
MKLRSCSVAKVFCLGTLLLAPAAAFAQAAAKLIPMPREYKAGTVAALAQGVTITSDDGPEDRFAAQDLAAWFDELGVHAEHGHSSVKIELLRADSKRGEKVLASAGVKLDTAMHDEGYAIVPEDHGLAVVADTAEGVFYGAQTVKQMVTGTGASATLAEATIRDWPAMKYRGVSDDLSRGPFPTLDFQKKQIRTLAAYKMNVYSPYFENTLQYASDPVPGLPGGSMSKDDVKALVTYAAQYHVMVIPEQEAFGHLHHVLKYEEYAPLAETPMGHVLAPHQAGSLDLIGQMFGEIAQEFPSPFLHIGADETADLGKGQTRDEVDKRGLGAVYVDFLLQIHQKLTPLNRRLMFWGDIGMHDPAEVKRLPKDMIAIGWEYSPNPKGYADWLKPYTDAGMETWVAPGVNDWNRVYPDNDYATRNIQGFVHDGQLAHSTGMLNTVWNDDGEGLFNGDWYGILFGAAAAWQPTEATDAAAFGSAYGEVFHGDATGKLDQAQREIIAIYQSLNAAELGWQTDRLYWVDPWSAEGQAMGAKLNPLVHEMRLHAERAITLIAEARAAGPLREPDAVDALDTGARRLDFIGQKFETAELIAKMYREAYASQNDAEKKKHIGGTLYTLSGANGLCEDVRDGYNYGRLRYSDVWLKENRPYWLQNVLTRYDLASQLWVTRSAAIHAAHVQWSAQHTLPAPESLGIPAENR